MVRIDPPYVGSVPTQFLRETVRWRLAQLVRRTTLEPKLAIDQGPGAKPSPNVPNRVKVHLGGRMAFYTSGAAKLPSHDKAIVGPPRCSVLVLVPGMNDGSKHFVESTIQATTAVQHERLAKVGTTAA